jgi:carboxyl-terminal processing protease
VQNLRPRSLAGQRGAALRHKLTIAQFFRVGGGSTENRAGADVAFPVSVTPANTARPTTTPAVDPHRGRTALATSRRCCRSWRRHGARIAGAKEFQWWAEDVAQFRKERADKSISLNEAERRSERDREDTKRKSRQDERKTLGLDLDPLAEDDSRDDGLQAGERDVARDVAREKAAEKRPDPLLRESAAILADAVRLLDNDGKLSAQVLPTAVQPGHWADSFPPPSAWRTGKAQ